LVHGTNVLETSGDFSVLNNIGNSRVIWLDRLSLAVKHSPFSCIFLALRYCFQSQVYATYF